MAKPLPAADLEFIIRETGPLWEEAKGARIFITGGTGFFGVWLLESFCAANRAYGLGAKATVLTRNAGAFRSRLPHLAGAAELTYIEADIKDLPGVSQGFDFAIHAASEAPPPREAMRPDRLLLGNVEGTRRFLDLVKRSGVRKFLFTSSGAAYGTQPPDVARLLETAPYAPATVNPASAYGESKRVSEFLCAACSEPGRREGKTARCFAFLGPHLSLDANYAIGNFIRDGLNGGPIRIAGDGTARRSYLYAADLAIWLWTLLFRGKSGQIYNVGGECDRSIAEIAAIVRDRLCPGAEISIASPRQPGTPVHRYVPDVGRAKGELGLAETIGLDDGVDRFANWLRLSSAPAASK